MMVKGKSTFSQVAITPYCQQHPYHLNQQRRSHDSKKSILQHTRARRPDTRFPTTHPRTCLPTINIPTLWLRQNFTPLPHHRHRHPPSKHLLLYPPLMPLSCSHPFRPPPSLQHRPPRRSMPVHYKNCTTSLQPRSPPPRRQPNNPRCYQNHSQGLSSTPAHLPSFTLILAFVSIHPA